MKKISVLNETKVAEVRCYPTGNSRISFFRTPSGVCVDVVVEKTSGRYSEHSPVSREELIELANSLLELAK